MSNKIKIIQKDSDNVNIYIDGVKIEGLQELKYSNSVNESPLIEVKFIPLDEIDIEVN